MNSENGKNKKVDKEFKYIHDEYLLQCMCTEMKNKINNVIDLAYQYAQIDGGHHKMWTIDQMIRILLGVNYDNFVKEYEKDGEYIWDTGIAP